MTEAAALLAHLTDYTRTHLLTYLEIELPLPAWEIYCEHLNRAADGEPLAYLTGEHEFLDLTFAITPDVLVPRPETELLVEEVLAWGYHRPSLRIADVGTGSGAIAVTLATHMPQAEVIANDISYQALRVARENSIRHGVSDRVCFVQSNLLAGIIGPFDVIIANLPYVQTGELPCVGDWEPRLALDGGGDGLAIIRALLYQAPSRLAQPDGLLLLEIGAAQGQEVSQLAQETFPGTAVSIHADLAGLDRVIQVRT
jgi:release factor glutamine methyltransferase